MMNDVRMNPGDLRHFARFLLELEQELAASDQLVQEAFEELSRKWRDQRFLEFAGKFNEAMEDISTFRSESIRFAEHLDEKARRAERFLER